MIILSGVLVVAAIALLVAGIVAGNGDSAQVFGLDALVVIYISIGVSIVSALCLAIGVFLRRKELFGPGVSTAPAKKRKPKRDKRDKRAKPAPAASGAAAPGPAGKPESGDDAVEIPAQPLDVPDDALVLVVRGRKRYHLDTCRQLAGRDTEELTYAEAREEGFSSCTACMPDTALAARAKTGGEKKAEENGLAGLARPAAAHSAPTPLDATAEIPRDEKPQRTPAGPTLLDLPVADLVKEKPDEPSPEEPERAKSESAKSEPEDEEKPEESPADATADLDPPAPRPRDAEQPDEPAEVPRQAPEPEAAEPKDAEEKRPAADPDGDDAQVRILSGTKRYHRTDCALIEDIGDEADDLESLSRTEAKARGCTPCLVCQPDRERARD
ncbi:hypothetical protein ACFHW2_27040 [Actinomadura sp. LOL_016]|uniref:hypothetical protein n=1 Tax=unclassified Actinomadura TaxID=2626254 RepID=UPI003A805BAD